MESDSNKKAMTTEVNNDFSKETTAEFKDKAYHSNSKEGLSGETENSSKRVETAKKMFWDATMS